MNIKSITGKTSILLISLLLAIPTLNAINAVKVDYLEKQEQVEKLHSAGFNPLHFAAFYGRVRSIQHLLKTNNALVNEKTNGGFTALHIAAMRGNDDAVRQPLNNEAAIDARDNEGPNCITSRRSSLRHY